MDKWDARFIELAKLVGSWSKDTTKVGCVIVGSGRSVLAMGYNGLPRGVTEYPNRNDRPAKYLYTEHAERNAIYNANRAGTPLFNSTIYLPWFPCADCARAVIQVGIVRLVGSKPDFNNQQWGGSHIIAHQMLIESGVTIVWE